jgi:hypothetical protein
LQPPEIQPQNEKARQPGNANGIALKFSVKHDLRLRPALLVERPVKRLWSPEPLRHGQLLSSVNAPSNLPLSC